MLMAMNASTSTNVFTSKNIFAPFVVNVTPKAGDVVLFTETLCHGARRWTLETPRLTVFVRYSTSYASWSPEVQPIEEYRDKLSNDVCELIQVAGFQHRKQIVNKLLTEMGTDLE